VRGFLRTSNGTFITVTAPNGGSLASGHQSGRDDRGDLFFFPRLLWHGFLRAPGGAITTFDPPGSSQTTVSGINSAGTIIGNYFSLKTSQDSTASGATADGTITAFDSPGSLFTTPAAISLYQNCK